MKKSHVLGLAGNLLLVLILSTAYVVTSGAQEPPPPQPRQATPCTATHGETRYRAIDYTIHDGYYRIIEERGGGVVLLPMANTVIFER